MQDSECTEMQIRSFHVENKSTGNVQNKQKVVRILDKRNEALETIKYNKESLQHDSVKFLYKKKLANKLKDNKNTKPSTAENYYNMIK